MKNISMLINTADKRSHINPEIYGHFSEHLGRCIYNGMYVGENSEIPNIRRKKRRYRSFQGDKNACSPLAGRLLCRRVSLEGRHRRKNTAQENDKHQLGWRDGG